MYVASRKEPLITLPFNSVLKIINCPVPRIFSRLVLSNRCQLYAHISIGDIDLLLETDPGAKLWSGHFYNKGAHGATHSRYMRFISPKNLSPFY